MRLSFLKKATIALALTGVFYHARCQQGSFPEKVCATADEVIPWLSEFQKKPHLSPRSNELIYVAVAIHIVGTDNSLGFISEQKVLDAFCNLNRHFEKAGIQFFLKGEIRQISNSNFYDHHSGDAGNTMMNMHNLQGAVNTYFVYNAADACGYTLRDKSGLGIGIVLSEACTGNSTSSWTHEMGHFFSLPHTFHGWERENLNWTVPAPARAGGIAVEYADGRGCSVAGDGFCDTPADYLNGRWFCGPQSQSQIVQLDPAGNSFRSDGSLFMSYAAEPCPTRFSPLQQEAMRAYLKSIRIDLLQQIPQSLNLTLREDVVLLQPANTSSVPTFQEVPLSWKRVSGAIGYLVELSFLPTFAFLSNSYLTKDTSLFLRDLKPSRTYFWRIRPFTLFSTCRVYSAARSFITGSVTHLAHPKIEDEALTLFPNPAHVNRPLSLRFQSEKAGKMEYELLDMMGRIATRGSWNLSSGENILQLDKLPDGQGAFLLRLRTEGKTLSRKVLIGP